MISIILLTRLFFFRVKWWIWSHFTSIHIFSPQQWRIRVKAPLNAIYRHSNHRITFGTGLDIYIADDANLNNASYTNFGYYLVSFQLEYKTGKAGTYWFTPDEVKMFYLVQNRGIRWKNYTAGAKEQVLVEWITTKPRLDSRRYQGQVYKMVHSDNISYVFSKNRQNIPFRS